MTGGKLVVSVAPTKRLTQFISVSEQMGPGALDEAIRAQLLHVAIGVGGTGSRVVRMLIDLSVYLSLDQIYAQGSVGHGVLLIPAESQTGIAAAHDAHEWDRTQMLVSRWSRACIQVRTCGGIQIDPMHSAIGEPLTLRLLFDAFNERQANDMADLLCAHFSAWHAATTSLREAMAAVRTTLIEPRQPRRVFMPLSYRSASVCHGWHARIADPTSFLQASAGDDGWREPQVSNELSAFFARRCEAVWYETAKALQAPEPRDEEPAAGSEDLGKSVDAADDFVCADRMLSLWYGKRRHRRRS